MKLNIISLSFLMLYLSCTKSDFLNEKPSSTILNPKTIADAQGLLDNVSVINFDAGLPTLSADEYYFQDYASWNAAVTQVAKYGYIWAKDIYNGTTSTDWNTLYTAIFYTNSALTCLDALKNTDSSYNFAKADALFKRAYLFYGLIQDFCLAYDSATAKTDLGIPLRLSPNIDDIQPRASLFTCYERIIGDLILADNFVSIPFNGNQQGRVSKAAIYALLARVYLSMRKYSEALEFSSKALGITASLTNFNNLNLALSNPFVRNNIEIIYYGKQVNNEVNPGNLNLYIIVDSVIYSSFDKNDIRRAVYFKINSAGLVNYRGAIDGTRFAFSGLTTSELFLIKAECLARAGLTSDCNTLLNMLLVKRYKAGTFIPYATSSSDSALSNVLLERRKELFFRNARWADLKRLNKEGYNITLTRLLNGVTYTLAPNSPLYALPIPDNEIISSGITQNSR